jgi:MYXO-CTERM domain-containing protein
MNMTSKRRIVGVFGGAAALLSFTAASPSWATTYQVGPARTLKRLQDIVGTLNPGDIVELDGNASYAGGVILDRPGTAALPITVRGVRVGGARPILTGGNNTIEVQGAYTVVEGLDITAGTSRCFYHHADHVTVRDTVIHDCPAQGLLGADNDSGSLLAEYLEIHHCGEGTQNHQIYMSTDPTVFPGAVFRLQYSYIHDGVGGNNVKSRAQRNEIYYNWIEGAYYHELELVGPDVGAGVVSAGQFRYDSEVVGNVLRKRGGANFWIVRFGGDLLENSSNGRYRFMSNTVVTEAGDPGVFRLHFGLESLEVDDNVFYAIGGATQTMIREAEANWVGGVRRVAGVNNWLTNAQFTAAPEWIGTLTGTDPGFANFAGDNLRPTELSPLVDHGTTSTAGYSGYALPNPLAVAQYEPPPHLVEANGSAKARAIVGVLDIGAYEYGTSTGAGGVSGTGGLGTGGLGVAGQSMGGRGVGGTSQGTAGKAAGGQGTGGLGGQSMGGRGAAGMGQGTAGKAAGGQGAGGRGTAGQDTAGQPTMPQETGGQSNRGGAPTTGTTAVMGVGASAPTTGGEPAEAEAGGSSSLIGGSPSGGTAVATAGAATAVNGGSAGLTSEASAHSSGCGCRTTGPAPSRGLTLLALLGLGVASRRIRGKQAGSREERFPMTTLH